MLRALIAIAALRYIISPIQVKRQVGAFNLVFACTLFSTGGHAFPAFKRVAAAFKSGAAMTRIPGTIVLFYGIVGLFRFTQQ